MHTGAMIPGQLGPTMRDLFWVLSMSVMRTMSGRVSMFSAYQFSCSRTVLGNSLGDAVHVSSVQPCWYAHLRHNQRNLRLDGLLNTGGSDRGAVDCQVIAVQMVVNRSRTGRRWRLRWRRSPSWPARHWRRRGDRGAPGRPSWGWFHRRPLCLRVRVNASSR